MTSLPELSEQLLSKISGINLRDNPQFEPMNTSFELRKRYAKFIEDGVRKDNPKYIVWGHNPPELDTPKPPKYINQFNYREELIPHLSEYYRKYPHEAEEDGFLPFKS